ncbi:MAG TPA: decaprenyl-phosphate phosphoribosyltransferase [Vicinamibacterales bacterium]|nr:decaprenyl-phosphate phosphoribosyltransferase [Vicinamibacterales bacterium]
MTSPLGRPTSSPAALLFRSLRPQQWTKNLFVFAGLLFSGHLLDRTAWPAALAAFFIFCGLSGAVYLVNDVLDRGADAQHPIKRHRPIASEALAPGVALTAALVLAALSVAGAVAVNASLTLAAVAYVALLASYSAALKHYVIIDVLTLAAGFVLRAVAGAVAIGVPISHWLLVCTTLLALFIGLSKRRHELTLLTEGAAGHRPILQEYSPYLLDQMISVVTAATLVAYSVYTISSETAERLGSDRLGITIPFVLYGIFRYLYLVHRRNGGGSPSELLLTDRPLLICVALWTAAVVLVIYVI